MTPRLVSFAVRCLGFVGLAIGLGGCVSTKYKRADKPTAPLELNLANQTRAVDAYLHSVIVFQGPGAWKREAYWDEYLISFVNHGDATVTIEWATLIDALNQEQYPGADPWILERVSRANLKKFEHVGKKIMIGAGLGVAWTMAPAVAYAGAWAGSSTIALVGVTTFFAVPAVLVSSLVMSHHAKNDIRAEFDRRRLPTPFVLPAHGVRTGSFFFPISPGPQNLQLKGRIAGEPFELVIDLAPLAGLHLLKQPLAQPSLPAAPVPH